MRGGKEVIDSHLVRLRKRRCPDAGEDELLAVASRGGGQRQTRGEPGKAAEVRVSLAVAVVATAHALVVLDAAARVEAALGDAAERVVE